MLCGNTEHQYAPRENTLTTPNMLHPIATCFTITEDKALVNKTVGQKVKYEEATKLTVGDKNIPKLKFHLKLQILLLAAIL